MRKLSIFCIGLDDLQIAFDSIGLDDKMINGFKGVTCKTSIAVPFFMWDYIVGYKYYFAIFPFFRKKVFCNSGNQSISGSKEWQPELEDDHIRLKTSNYFSGSAPGKWINGVNDLQ